MVRKELLSAVFLACFSISGTVVAAKFIVPFDIPAGTLSESLIKFAKQADVTLSVSNQDVGHVEVPALKGVMTLPQALDQLLMDSGLGYRFLDRDTVSIAATFHKPLPSDKEKAVASEHKHQEPRRLVTEEVTVTAQRTSENLQKVPVAVSVLDQYFLQESGITNLADINARVPGLTITSFSLGQPSIHVRGIGSNDDGAAMDNSVVAFVDDIYVGRITHIDLNLLDLERVEVLRGPQGTLYGKNAIGGAIKLVSKQPSETPFASATLGTGNYQHQEIAGLVNGPLSENWLGRLHLKLEQRDGWQKNLLSDQYQHDNQRQALRARTLYRPNDRLELHWNFDGSRENLNSTGRIPIHSTVPLRVLDARGHPVAQLDNQGNPVAGDDGTPLYQHRLPTELFHSLGGDWRHALNGLDGYTDRTIWGISQRLEYQLDSGVLTSISGYRRSHFDWLEDSTGLPLSVTNQTLSNGVDEVHRQFSQEIRWSSTTEGPLSYLVGLYYLQENTLRKESWPFQHARPSVQQDNRGNSFAAYGQFRYRWWDKLQLQVGARYTYDHKSLKQQGFSDNAPAVIQEDFSVESRDSWTDLSPFISLSYNHSDDLMLYSSVARGMKSGGFQGAPSTEEQALRSIDPEFAWDLELGMKSQWLADLMRLNVAAFYTDYRDLQVVQFRTIDNYGVFETNNAASATVKGIELEMMASPLPGLTLSGSYAFLRATYDSFNDFSGRDFTGNTLRQAPKNSLVLGVHYEFPILSGELHLRADYRYQSKSYREPDNLGTVQPSFWLLDGSLTYIADNQRWQISLWGKNLTDESYITHLYRLGGNDYALFGTPRTYGLNLTWNFE
ncbi:TonB-dependent receptor [Pseudomaricurvus alkylphenolicus]|jgi:iron complex outermembrane receptor protein|uniref:TonB-dependent receptor domain-containing protein n=1 Tax=Pseudomaricurvus alkylphenolicus TaxID=1306991 RepID=UPI00141E69EA|nr:TonB-dependent receptor [Pseudomaricurvus alkylphenolicus]NIB43890.1 TonB-dependent receptor [Pseudomaricurvus alkylphenolicus]